MSLYTRLASTDAQEESIRTVEKAFKKANRSIAGYTTIGRSPQTVILDIKHHGSEIYINADGVIQIDELFLGELEYEAGMEDAIAESITRKVKQYEDERAAEKAAVELGGKD